MEDATSVGGRSHLTVGIRELRDSLSRHVGLIRDGAEITVTDHGRPVARLVPVEDDAYSRLLGSGRLLAAERPEAARPRRRPVGPVSDLIER